MTTPTPTPRRRRGSMVVALVLAIGICTALNVLTIGVLVDALFSVSPGLSENATQILTGWGGGVLSVIGAAIGYQMGESRATRDAETDRIKDANGPDSVQ